MRIVLLLILLAANQAQAKPVLTATCAVPVGQRFDQVNGTVQQKSDGFDGVNPLFIIDDEKPNVLTFVWGPAEWARDSLKLKAAAQQAVIITSTEDKITAVRVEGEHITQMYSLYPKKGLVLFSQHRLIGAMNGVPTVGMFHAKCSFAG